MKKRAVREKSKEISITIVVLTIIIAILLSLIISFLTLNFSANSAESLDAGRIIVQVVPSTGVQQGIIIVEIQDKPKPIIVNNEK